MKHPGKEAGMDDKQDIEFSALEPFAAPLDEIGTLPAVLGSCLSMANSQLKPPPEAETTLGNVFPIDTG